MEKIAYKKLEHTKNSYNYETDSSTRSHNDGLDIRSKPREHLVLIFLKRCKGLSLKEKLFLLIVCSLILLYLSTNFYNPTLLPVQLRFPPKCYHLSKRNNASQLDKDAPIYIYPSPIKRDYTYINDHSWIPRFTTLKTHRDTIELLGNLSQLFEMNNITYIINHGTLLGSFIFHDMIPWDDDLDILVSFKSINRVRALFRDPRVMEEFDTVPFKEPVDLYSPEYIHLEADPENPYFCGHHISLAGKICKHKFHFFRRDAEKTLRREIGFPYIDVQFYAENSTHVWPTDKDLDDISFKKTDFYPLHYRPFFNLWQPAPKETRKWLKVKFHKFKCASKWYSHQTQTFTMGYETSCDCIKECYPYVKRRPHTSSKTGSCRVMEQLVIGDTVIHEAIIDETYSGHFPFEL